MKIKFVPFETIDPVMSITKLGAGQNLYALAEDEHGNLIGIKADGISLQDVAELAERGIQFILKK